MSDKTEEGKVCIAQDNTDGKWHILIQFSDHCLVGDETFDTEEEARKSAQIEWSDQLPAEQTTIRIPADLKDEDDVIVTLPALRKE